MNLLRPISGSPFSRTASLLGAGLTSADVTVSVDSKHGDEVHIKAWGRLGCAMYGLFGFLILFTAGALAGAPPIGKILIVLLTGGIATAFTLLRVLPWLRIRGTLRVRPSTPLEPTAALLRRRGVRGLVPAKVLELPPYPVLVVDQVDEQHRVRGKRGSSLIAMPCFRVYALPAAPVHHPLDEWGRLRLQAGLGASGEAPLADPQAVRRLRLLADATWAKAARPVNGLAWHSVLPSEAVLVGVFESPGVALQIMHPVALQLGAPVIDTTRPPEALADTVEPRPRPIGLAAAGQLSLASAGGTELAGAVSVAPREPDSGKQPQVRAHGGRGAQERSQANTTRAADPSAPPMPGGIRRERQADAEVLCLGRSWLRIVGYAGIAAYVSIFVLLALSENSRAAPWVNFVVAASMILVAGRAAARPLRLRLDAERLTFKASRSSPVVIDWREIRDIVAAPLSVGIKTNTDIISIPVRSLRHAAWLKSEFERWVASAAHDRAGGAS